MSIYAMVDMGSGNLMREFDSINSEEFIEFLEVYVESDGYEVTVVDAETAQEILDEGEATLVEND